MYLVYVGKLGGWYMIDEMVDFFEAALQSVPNLRWQIWTQSDPTTLQAEIGARGLSDRVAIGQVPADALPDAVSRAHAGLSFIRSSVSKWASSPTKVGEYLAAGLPVVSTSGIGDLDSLLGGSMTGGPVGVVLRDLSPQGHREGVRALLALLQDPRTPGRCRAAAEQHLDLRRVGWPRYRELYSLLMASPKTEMVRNDPVLPATVDKG
jgi:glycosyltransferase involved in cell wall biosynthesis